MNSKRLRARNNEGLARVKDSRGVPEVLGSNRLEFSTWSAELKRAHATPRERYTECTTMDNRGSSTRSSNHLTTVPFAEKTLQKREDNLPAFGSFSSTTVRRKRQCKKQTQDHKQLQQNLKVEQQKAANSIFQEQNRANIMARLLGASYNQSSLDDNCGFDETFDYEESLSSFDDEFNDPFSTDELFMMIHPSIVHYADIDVVETCNTRNLEPTCYINVEAQCIRATLTVQEECMHHFDEILVYQQSANPAVITVKPTLSVDCLLQMALLYCLIYCNATIQYYTCVHIPVLHVISNLGRRYVSDIRTN